MRLNLISVNYKGCDYPELLSPFSRILNKCVAQRLGCRDVLLRKCSSILKMGLA